MICNFQNERDGYFYVKVSVAVHCESKVTFKVLDATQPMLFNPTLMH